MELPFAESWKIKMVSVKVRDKNVKNGSKKLTTIYFN